MIIGFLFFPKRNFKKQISEPVELHLNKPCTEMWDNVLKSFRDTLDKAETSYLTKAKSNDTLPRHNLRTIY